jgi:PD-(D/E)XK endonuclease
MFNSRATDHGQGPQPYFGLADIFGVYFPPNRSVYLVPLDEVAMGKARLRLQPTRNNQKRGIRLAADYEVDRWSVEALCEVAASGGSRSGAELSFA